MDELPSQFEIDYSHLGEFNDDEGDMVAGLIKARILELAPEVTGYGKSTLVVEPGEDKGEFEVDMVGYMWALNNGFKPFIMKGLIGKTIPIRLPMVESSFEKLLLRM